MSDVRASASADWSVMDNRMALVACGGKWVPATREQLEVIKLGQDATAHQPVYSPETFGPLHDYEYVIMGGGSQDSHLKNVYTGKCRAVLIVPIAARSVWDEPINHPPRGF
jgi:hypothetical protein